MSWNARKDLLERGFIQIDERDSECFTRGDMVAYLEYDSFPPHAVTVRLVGKIGEKVHTLDVLSSHWLDIALEILDLRGRDHARREAKKRS